MNTTHARKYVSRYLAISLLITLIPSLTSAQGDAPLWYDVRIMELKPEREAEFEDLIAQVTLAVSAAGHSPITVWEEVRGRLATYHLVIPIETVGDFDDPSDSLMEAVPVPNLMARIVDCVDSERRMLIRNYLELAIPAGDPSEPPGLMMLRIREITWGGDAQFSQWLRDHLLPTLEDAGFQGVGVGRVFAGDSPRTWILSTPMESWAEFDGRGPFADLSETEREQIFGAGNSLIQHGENLLLRRRGDLMPGRSRL